MAGAEARDEARDAVDRRFMAAAIRLSRKHAGLTSTNPSVGTLIVRDDGAGPVIVGRGVTAIGGRPHAEAEALAEAGELARGATAYVTLEPCAHHGRTPPCANALVTAGVARVVGAASDPDGRVSGKGYAILRPAGIEVVENVLADEAADAMAGYLIRSSKKRPEVILKLALSGDGMIGRPGEGQIAITGDVARRQVHLMRAEADAILVGIGTALADDPELTVRLPGLESRSPVRIVLDREARLPLTSKLVRLGAQRAAACRGLPGSRSAPQGGARTGRRAVPGDRDLRRPRSRCRNCSRTWRRKACRASWSRAARRPRRHFLDEGLVDRIVLFCGAVVIGEGGIAAPIDRTDMPAGFRLLREARYRRRPLRGMDQGRLMFTGIVTDVGTVASAAPLPKGVRLQDRNRLRPGNHRHRRVDLLRRRLPDRHGLPEAGSNARWFEVEAWEEALRLTTARGWGPGTRINLERALKIGDELGGHIVSGHVDGMAEIVAREDEGDAVRFTLEAPRELAKFIAPKGSVALDGTSLTVNNVDGTASTCC